MTGFKSVVLSISIILTIIFRVQAQDAELIERISDYSIRNSKLIQSEKFTIQINNRSGEKYSSIKIPFTKGNDIKNFNILLTDKNGNEIRKIKKSEIVDVSAFASYSFYEDEYYKTIDIKHNQYPYRISYSYQKEYSEYIQIANWYPVLDLAIPTRKGVLTFSCPAEYKFTFKPSHISDFTTGSEDGRITYTWHIQHNNLVREEIYSPPLEESLPGVQIIPEKFNYGLEGSFESWHSFGDWVYALNDGLDDLPDYEKQKIDALVKSCPDDKSKIKKLYEYLQKNTRYVNIKLGIGGLRSYPAEYVSRNKYGDCKALTNYLKSALKYVGIQSHFALINAGENQEKINIDFPSQQFNHVILYISLNGEDIWLECTDSTSPYNYLGSFTQNRQAFIIENGNSRFVMTPALKTNDVYDLAKSKIIIQNDNTLNVKTNYIFRGTDYFDFYKYLHHSGAQKELEKYVDKLSIFPNSHILERNIDRDPKAPEEIKIELDSKQDLALRKYGNEILFDLPALDLPDFESPERRTHAVRIDHPIHKIDTFFIHYPGNITLLENSESETIEAASFGKYSFTNLPCPAQNCLRFAREFYLDPGTYGLTEYKALYNFLTDIKKAENRKIIFKSKE